MDVPSMASLTAFLAVMDTRLQAAVEQVACLSRVASLLLLQRPPQPRPLPQPPHHRSAAATTVPLLLAMDVPSMASLTALPAMRDTRSQTTAAQVEFLSQVAYLLPLQRAPQPRPLRQPPHCRSATA